jgi:hypothetical protein
MATLGEVLDQEKNDGHYWQLAIPLTGGVDVPKKIEDWLNDPVVEALISVDAETGTGCWRKS